MCVACLDIGMPLLPSSGAIDHTYGISYIVRSHSAAHASSCPLRSSNIRPRSLRYTTLNYRCHYFNNPFTGIAPLIRRQVKRGAVSNVAVGQGLALLPLEV